MTYSSRPLNEFIEFNLIQMPDEKQREFLRIPYPMLQPLETLAVSNAGIHPTLGRIVTFVYTLHRREKDTVIYRYYGIE